MNSRCCWHRFGCRCCLDLRGSHLTCGCLHPLMSRNGRTAGWLELVAESATAKEQLNVFVQVCKEISAEMPGIKVTSTNYLQCLSQVDGPGIVGVLVLMDVLSMGAPIGAWREGCSSSYSLLCLLFHPMIVLDLWCVG